MKQQYIFCLFLSPECGTQTETTDKQKNKIIYHLSNSVLLTQKHPATIQTYSESLCWYRGDRKKQQKGVLQPNIREGGEERRAEQRRAEQRHTNEAVCNLLFLQLPRAIRQSFPSGACRSELVITTVSGPMAWSISITFPCARRQESVTAMRVH